MKTPFTIDAAALPNGANRPMNRLPLTALLLLAAACAETREPVNRVTQASSTPAFVQISYACPQGSFSSASVTLGKSESAGDLNVVVLGWNDVTSVVQSVTDTQGNTYQLAAGPQRNPDGPNSQAIYYAAGIKGGANTVTATLSASAWYPDLRVAEYSGVSALDTSAGTSGFSTTASAGPITTSTASEVLVAAGTTESAFTGAGSGWTKRVITSPNLDLVEDKITTSAGAYTATAANDGQQWVFQVVAFKAAGSSDAGSDATADAPADAPGDVSDAPADVASEATDAADEAQSESGDAPSADANEAGQDATADSAAEASGDGGLPSYVFPIHAQGRYLVDATGKPFLLVGDSIHGLIADYTEADADKLFADRAARGFNAAWVQLVATPYTGGPADGSTYDGIQPFLSYSNAAGVPTPDLSQPNPAYFARVDDMINLAAKHGILVLLDPLDAGGWAYSNPVIQDNGATKAAAFGSYVGARYASFPNVLWLNGNDWFNWSSDPAGDADLFALASAIHTAAPSRLQTIELGNPTSGSLDAPRWAPFVTLDLAYSYCPQYEQTLTEYNRAGPNLPVFFGETTYEGDSLFLGHAAMAWDTRLGMWWPLTSGAAGSVYGDSYEWPQDVIAADPGHLDLPGANDMPNLVSFFASRAWWNLVPDQTQSIVTAGFGTPGGCGTFDQNDYATAAATADGTLVVAYLPTPRAVTVNLSRLAGPSTARWYDPTSGAYTTISSSVSPGTYTWTPASRNGAGDPDWVLVVEAAQ